jgi:hypothetical protein
VILAPEPQEFKSTNVKLTANSYSLTTLANRRWSNIFSLSPRHRGRSTLDNVSNTNTSSTVNSNNSLSTSSRDTTAQNVTDEASRTEVGAISAALPVIMCGLKVNSMLPSAPPTELKNSVDDNAEQKITSVANLGTEMNASLSHCFFAIRFKRFTFSL